MTRLVWSWLVVVLAVVVAGCSPSPTAEKQPAPVPDSGTPASVASDGTPDAPAADAGVPAAPAAASEPAAAPPAMDTPPADSAVPSPPAEPDLSQPADVPAPKLPFEDLVAAVGNARLSDIYQQTEARLAEAPTDEEMRMQRVAILNAVGGNLAAQGNQERAMEAFRVALEQAQLVMADLPQPTPEQYAGFLAGVFYNGACAQSLDGKTEDAMASLQQAIALGFDDLGALRDDPDLAAVRALPEFEQQFEAWSTAIREMLTQRALAVLAEGESFPFDFTLADLAGQPISLASLQGKVVIVDIWGTWCPPCRAEVPSFIRLQEEYGPQGLQIVGLNYERVEDEAQKAELVRNFIQETGINYPCALGTDEIQQQVPDFSGFPTTLFIDRTGRVRAKVVGAHDFVYLEAIVRVLLEEAVPPPVDAPQTPPADAAAETPPADAAPQTPPADAAAEAPPADAAPQTPPADAAADTPPADAADEAPAGDNP